MTEKPYTVRVAHCDYRASEEEIYQTLRRITDPLTRSWAKIQNAKKVLIKFNMMKLPERIAYFQGRRRELVDDAVCRAVLRLLREHTTAQLVAVDTCIYTPDRHVPLGHNYDHHLRDFGVQFVDINLPPFKEYMVPGGGLMFQRYTLNAALAEADAFVSVAKLKNHAYMGVTLCTKNLFGLPPTIPPEGRARNYYHHFVRLPYVLADLAMITNPCLNIIDALTGQAGREWGGEGRIGNALIAGDHIIATDACGAYLMGHDPTADWPTPPFRRDRNHLLVAAEHGFGTVSLADMDFESEVSAPLNQFDAAATDPWEMVASWRRTTCEQALFYLERRQEFVDRYAGDFIYLQDGEVIWRGRDPSMLWSRRLLSGAKRDRALWLKLVDPQEREGEHFHVYQACLAAMSSEAVSQARA